MSICVLCLQNKQLTEEHIVPDAIGGGLKANILCVTCNSTLGSTIDGPFINSEIIQLPRLNYQIKSRSGHIPNPFSRFGEAEHDGKELKIRMDDEFKPYTKRDIKEEATENGLELSITIDKEDEGEIESILSKKITRHFKSLGMEDDKIKDLVADAIIKAKSALTPVSHRPFIKYSFAIDLNAQILESIKIAYEIAVIEFGESYYMTSPVAEKMRHCLKVINYDGVRGRYGVDPNELKFLMQRKDSHYVIFIGNICLISIFGMVSSVEWCQLDEDFSRTPEKAFVYEFDAVSGKYTRRSLLEHVEFVAANQA